MRLLLNGGDIKNLPLTLIGYSLLFELLMSERERVCVCVCVCVCLIRATLFLSKWTAIYIAKRHLSQFVVNKITKAHAHRKTTI